SPSALHVTETVEEEEDGNQIRQLKYQLSLVQADKDVMAQKHMEELNAVVYTKDQEIENLNGITEGWAERDMYFEGVTKKLLGFLDSVVQQQEKEEMGECSLVERLDKTTCLMIGKYNRLQSEVGQLKQFVNDVGPEILIPEDAEFGSILDVACRVLVEHKTVEYNFIEKINQAEDENKKLLEELDNVRKMIDVSDGEVRKVKMELEQEKNKSATTKEKLGMAVTKGKALIQQRDLLKQSLIEKTTELEKCLLELQEKSNALEFAEMRNIELADSRSYAASLQESLSERDMAVAKIEDILSRTDIPDGVQSMDIIDCVKWLADQKVELQSVSMEYEKVKSILSSLDLPEEVASSKLEFQISWLGESLSVAKDTIVKLQVELISTKVVSASIESATVEAFDEIDHLKTSLLAQRKEKDSLQMMLGDLSSKFEANVEMEFKARYEKDKMLEMFLEACGVEDHGGVPEAYSDMRTVLEKCVGRMREEITNSCFESTYAGKELLERTQTLLYVRDQEVTLCKDILEEEMLKRSEATNIANEFERVSMEIMALKEEKDSLQKDLERSDDKSALLREKLTMAVKKGKGLVQEREGLKQSLDEKDGEIQTFKLELEQQGTMVSEYRDQINKLSSDLEHIPKLESDILTLKDKTNHLEKYLLESNSMLESVVDSMESVVLPVDNAFEDPVAKVRWLAECCKEYHSGKFDAEQELQEVKKEAGSLSGELVEARATISSLGDALTEAEKNYVLLAEEKKALETGKTHVERELENAKGEASSQGSKFAEVCSTIKSLEDALSRAKENISLLELELTSACVDKTCVEKELDKAKEGADYQASKLAEAYATMKSLEEGSSLLEESLSVLTGEKTAAQAGIAALENELEKVKGEADSHASKLADVYATVKSLEDALSTAENNISVLTAANENAEMEIQTLNSRLNASMEELAGTHGSVETQSAQLFSHLNQLKEIMNDNSLLLSFTQGFNKKVESLRDMNLLLESVRVHFPEQGSEQLQMTASTEKDPYLAKSFSSYIDEFPNGTVDNIEPNATDINDILTKTVEGFKKRNQLIEDKWHSFSSSIDELIAILLRELQATKDNVIDMLNPMEVLKLEFKNLEAYKQATEGTVSTLKNDIMMLLSVWADSTDYLGFQMDNSLVNLSSNLEQETLNRSLYRGTRKASGDAMEQQLERPGGDGNGKEAESFLTAAREVRSQIKYLENVNHLTLTAIKELQGKLQEAQVASENSMIERDLNQNKVSMLERDLQALKDLCSGLETKLKDYEAKEDMLNQKDADFSLMYHSLAMKERGTEGYLLPEGQAKRLFGKIDQIKPSLDESDLDKSVIQYSAPVKKFFVILDYVTTLQHDLKSLSHDKEDLQSSLWLPVHEVEYLKKEISSLLSISQDLEKTNYDLAELTIELEKLIQKFGGNVIIRDNKFGVKGLLSVLENLVVGSILECETSKSKAQESVTKLHDNQKVLDELSEKVKLLEDSSHNRPTLPDAVQERRILEPSFPSGSEISEIGDEDLLGKNSVSPVQSAAHAAVVRTMRKGSSDHHIALTIDSESDRLVNHQETDEDKGHAFKSLNTSGLVPKQGKQIADRIDGIWVSGGRVLMSQPRARIGLMAYCILLHLWILGIIL
ncbi:hypothetical protein IFM89_005860, partial [Coptis chinensis]